MEQIRSGLMVGRTVLVTGGSGGIGRATALGLDILHGRVAGVISRIQPGRSVSGQRQAGRERGHIWLIGERAIRPPLGALLSERDEDFGVGGLGG